MNHPGPDFPEDARLPEHKGGVSERTGSERRRYPASPVVGVGAIILQNQQVLLVRRGREPLQGYWSLPGGAVETGESLEQALLREVREETSLDVEPLFLAALFERLMQDSDARTEFHYVLLDYVCELKGSSSTEPMAAVAGDDAAELGWFALDEAETLHMTPGTFDVIAKAYIAYDCWRATRDLACAGMFLRLSESISMPTAGKDLA